MKDIMIVDDEKDIRTLLTAILEDEGHQVRSVANSTELFEALKGRHPSIILLDIWLKKSNLDGIEILHNLVKFYPHIDVVMISGHGNAETAVRAMQIGAYDFLEKPIKSSHLFMVIERILKYRTYRLCYQTSYSSQNKPVFLQSSMLEMTNIRNILQKHADRDSRFLISGEVGTGKSELAKYIHYASHRKEQNYIELLTSQIKLDPFVLEKALFGYSNPENPEYVGSLGAFEKAHMGTIYLEHVDLYPHNIQKKIVKFLADKKYQRFMSPDKIVHCDVRIIASTSMSPELSIGQNLLLHDLFVRLNVVCINLPSLKNRQEDIPVLVHGMIAEICVAHAMPTLAITEDLILFLQMYHWKKNLKQLRNVIEMLVLDAKTHYDQRCLDIEHLPQYFHKNHIKQDTLLTQNSVMNKPLREARELFERDYLVAQLNRFKGNISKTAQFVGMERSALHRKLRGLEIENIRESEEAL